MYDIIVIGGGPAGLQAALTAGRMHRTVLLLDSGEYRNATVAHAHNLLTNDGRSPAELRRIARDELAAYETVEVRGAEATAVSGALGDFEVATADGVERAARIVLATGMRDALRLLREHNMKALPVVDLYNLIVGILTQTDMMDKSDWGM